MKNLVNSGSLNKRGVSTVEFALVLPIFIFSIFALIDFSMYYYMESSMTHVVRMTMRNAVTGKKVLDSSGTNYLTRLQGVQLAAMNAAKLPLLKYRSDPYALLNSGNYSSDFVFFYSCSNGSTNWQLNDPNLSGSGARIKMVYVQTNQFLTPLVGWLNTNTVTTNKISITTTYKAEEFDIN